MSDQYVKFRLRKEKPKLDYLILDLFINGRDGHILKVKQTCNMLINPISTGGWGNRSVYTPMVKTER